MMDRRIKNVSIFNDTMDWISENKELNDAVALSMKNQKLYLESEEIEISETPGRTCDTVVSKKRSFEAAAVYARAGKKVCVLNFASATNPGVYVCKSDISFPERMDKKDWYQVDVL
jgi:hypothetical protein